MLIIVAYLSWAQPFLLIGAPFLLLGTMVYLAKKRALLEDVIGKTGDGVFGLLAMMNTISKGLVWKLVQVEFALECREDLQGVRLAAAILQSTCFLAYILKNAVGVNKMPDDNHRKSKVLRTGTYVFWLLVIGCEYLVMGAVVLIIFFHRYDIIDSQWLFDSVDHPSLWLTCYIIVLCAFVLNLANAGINARAAS